MRYKFLTIATLIVVTAGISSVSAKTLTVDVPDDLKPGTYLVTTDDGKPSHVLLVPTDKPAALVDWNTAQAWRTAHNLQPLKPPGKIRKHPIASFLNAATSGTTYSYIPYAGEAPPAVSPITVMTGTSFGTISGGSGGAYFLSGPLFNK